MGDMPRQDFLFGSGSVSEGHPDKVADQIADAILDAILEQDPGGRVACEIMVMTGAVLIAGEFFTSASIDMPGIARQTIREIGYTGSEMGFDWRTCAVLVAIDKQSRDIAQGVDESEGHEQGAGDQGVMFGYACNETEVLMPAPIYYAHILVRRQAQVRKSGVLSWLWPDAKSEITLRYEKGEPVAVDTVVFSTQHAPDVTDKILTEAVMEEIIKPVLPVRWLNKDTRFHINPRAGFVTGGPMGECGLTGHQLIADTYGAMSRHGGGALSGKDPSKVDRSAAYAMRYLAKNIVAAGLARRCELQISYVIGRAEPISLTVNTFGTGKLDDVRLGNIMLERFNLKPKAVIDMFDLLRPIYRPVAAYGHFGRDDIDLPWESVVGTCALIEACPL